MTSTFGAGPLGGTTFGSFESGPVVGVVGVPLLVVAPAVALASAAATAAGVPDGSAPTVMLLPPEELEDPQPALAPATATSANPSMSERPRW
jgi:hypothetical protein